MRVEARGRTEKVVNDESGKDGVGRNGNRELAVIHPKPSLRK